MIQNIKLKYSFHFPINEQGNVVGKAIDMVIKIVQK